MANILENSLIQPAQLILHVDLTPSSETGIPPTTPFTFGFGDADQIAASLGLFGVATFKLFDSTTSVPISSILEFIKTYALIIKSLNVTSNIPQNLGTGIILMDSAIDGNYKTRAIDFANYTSNKQVNPNLFNIDTPFVITNTTSLKINALAGSGDDGMGGSLIYTNVTITMNICRAVPYANLTKFLQEAKIPYNKNGC